MTETAWAGLLDKEGFAQSLFLGMEYYSDETTMALINAVARHLDMPLEKALQEFGRVWIDFAGASDYGRILRMAGRDLVSFLESLDRMHASIRSNMPKAEMPTFELFAVGPIQIQVRYRSKRKGLAPFVKGILLAVAQRFDEPVTITYCPEEDGALFTIMRSDHYG